MPNPHNQGDYEDAAREKLTAPMKTKITNENLEPYIGRWVELYCQVGVVMSVTGTLLNGCGLCRWGIRLSNGQDIGFSYGEFSISPNGWLSVTIN